jgi:tryptophan synthase alpha chain
MKNRINTLFENKKQNILSLYFTAGFPNLDDTLSILKSLEESDVDLIEIGFPYSDPLADGPVIQESSGKAIENGMTLKLLFEQLKSLRTITQKPVILMGYLNVVLQFGESQFIEKCAQVGIDGIILPDMPLHYFQTNFKELCAKNKVSTILLITPETSNERIVEIDQNASGFIYLVASNSITGGTNSNALQTDYYQRIQDMNLANPHLIGFGIHDKTSFDTVSKFSSGAIIGTAFIKYLKNKGVSKASIKAFVDEFKS